MLHTPQVCDRRASRLLFWTRLKSHNVLKQTDILIKNTCCLPKSYLITWGKSQLSSTHEPSHRSRFARWVKDDTTTRKHDTAKNKRRILRTKISFVKTAVARARTLASYVTSISVLNTFTWGAFSIVIHLYLYSMTILYVKSLSSRWKS